jgi:hypothetical protein
VARGSAPALLLEVQGAAADPGTLSLRLAEGVPRLHIENPRAPVVLRGGELPPSLTFRDPAEAPYHVLALEPDALGSRAGFLAVELPPVPGIRTLDIARRFGAMAEPWRERVLAAAERFPNFEGFWILLELRGVIGDPPWVQSRSAPLPLLVRFD